MEKQWTPCNHISPSGHPLDPRSYTLTDMVKILVKLDDREGQVQPVHLHNLSRVHCPYKELLGIVEQINT